MANNGIGPVHIREVVNLHVLDQSLQSRSTLLLTVPNVRSKMYDERQFKWAAASLRDILLNSLRKCKSLESFKSQLNIERNFPNIHVISTYIL